MTNVVLFRSRVELDAVANLQDFVALCRDRLTVFGANLNFDENVWDVTEAIALKGKSGANRAVFSNWAAATGGSEGTMAEPFCSFAKAYFRYQHGVRPNKSIGMRLAALRALEAALTENGGEADPSRVHRNILNRAAQLSSEHFSQGVAYCVGIQLEMLAQFLSHHRLVPVATQWRNPLKRPSNDLERVGAAFDQRRQEKLPSAKALEALAHAFRAAKEPTDVLVSSIAAVLCSAPERINEVLRLRSDCEVNVERAGEKAYGLRWLPSKGAEPQVKWLVPSMADVVRKALARIREHTEQARRISRWYERHPRSLYLSRQLRHLRTQEFLSMPEVSEVLFATPVGREVARQWCERHKVPLVKQGGRLFTRFPALEDAVLKLLPRGFPVLDEERNLKYSDALCVLQRNALHDRRATYRCLIAPIDQDDIQNRLGGRSASGLRSIFDRLGFVEEDGSPIRIATHQFRHYLNTLAQAGGMGQLDIAKWSGRKDIRQNAAYDHVSDRSVLMKLHEAVGDERRLRGPLTALQQVTPIPRDEFARLMIPTAHTTEVGYCIHDYVMSPCQLHRDCFHCQELICVKGDAHKEAAIRQQHIETQELLAHAMKAAQDSGVSRWVDHQRETLNRLDELCRILDDPAVPNGAFIQLSTPKHPPRLQASPSARALEPLTAAGRAGKALVLKPSGDRS